MERFAYYMLEQIECVLPTGQTLTNIAGKTDRYVLFKVGPILIVSVSIDLVLVNVVTVGQHACTFARTQARAYACTHMNTHACTRTHGVACMHTHTHTLAHSHSLTRTLAHSLTLTLARSLSRSSLTHTHARTHTHTQCMHVLVHARAHTLSRLYRMYEKIN